ncbi:MAG: hypothetical protein AB1705_25215, partial [Verrucomicrobiota bacterium]
MLSTSACLFPAEEQTVVVEEVPHDDQSPGEDSLTPQEEVVDITSGGVSSEFVSTPDTEEIELEGEAASEVSPATQEAGTDAGEDLTMEGESVASEYFTPDDIDSMVDQLTGTLHSANGPPGFLFRSLLPGDSQTITLASHGGATIALETFIEDRLAEYASGLLSGTNIFTPGDALLDGWLELRGLKLTFSNLNYNPGTSSFTSGTIAVEATEGTLFEGEEFTGTITDGNDADVLALTGTYDVPTEDYSFTLDQMVLTVGEALEIDASGTTITYDSNNANANQTLVTVTTATLTSPLLDGVGSVALSSLVIRRNGFHVADTTLLLPNGGTGTVGNFLTVTGFQLSVDDLDVAYAASTTVTGSVTVTLAGLALFPNGSFLSTDAQNITGTFDFSSGTPTGDLTVTLGTVSLALGEALKLEATNVTVRPGEPDVIATIASATLSSPQFSGLGSINLANVVLRRTGFSIGTASLTTTQVGLGAIGDVVGRILSFDTVTVSVNNIALNYTGGITMDGSISVTVTNAVLFPEVDFINYALGNLTGTYTLSGPPTLNLDIPAFNLPIGEAVVIRMGAVQLRPGQEVMLSVASAAVESNLIGGLSGSITNFQLRRTGFNLGNLTINASGTNTIGDFMTLSGVSLVINNFTLDRTAGTPVTGSITLNVSGLSLFPNSSFLQTTVTGLSATYDFSQGVGSNGQLSFSMTSLELVIAGTAKLTAANVTLVPGDMTTEGSNDISLALTGSLDVLGQVMEGSFTYTRANGVMTISAAITRFELTTGGAQILELSGNGDFLVTSQGVAGSFTLSLASGSAIPNLTLAGTFGLQVNTTPAAVAFGTTTIPAGPYFRVVVQSATVGVLGNSITADSFVMEKSGTGASEVVKVAASGVGLQLQAATASLTVSDGAGAFAIYSTGAAGSVTVQTVVLSGVPGVSLSATGLTVQVNTTGADVGPVVVAAPGGDVTIQYTGTNNHNFVRVAGTVNMAVDGFMEFSGSFSFERGTMT